MYEYTADELHALMLNAIDDTYQKTIGFPTYDITRAFAIICKSLYDALQEAVDKMDVDNLFGEELTRFVFQRKGVIRKSAVAATVTLKVTGTGTVTKGDLFETSTGVQFAASENVSIVESGYIPATAVIAGASGNVTAGSIVQIPKTIQGITAVTNPVAAGSGTNEETDDALRQRYYAALQKPATSGNIYHYEQWATECAGVKAAKVFPLWNGANTVKVIIIDDEGEPASAELVAAVQAYIDPGISGNGSGAAPIGAYCTVAAADGVALTIAVTVQIVVGYTQEEVEENITAQIRAYLNEIAFQQDYVSYGKIAACIIDAEGVEDYSNLTMNDGMENITLSETEVATLGTVTISNA